MRFSILIKRALLYYWRTNLAVVFGVAAAVAVLTGALFVGDSVRASLRSLVVTRLGETDYVVSGRAFFRERLADDLAGGIAPSRQLAGVCPIIALEAVVTHEPSRRASSGVQVYGVDERFWQFNNLSAPGDADFADLSRQVFMSPGLAHELGAAPGDGVLVRVQKPSAIPLESLYARKDDVGRTTRLITAGVLPASSVGEFSLRPQQGSVRAVFVPMARLQRELGQLGRVNTLLVATSGDGTDEAEQSQLEEALANRFEIDDLGIRLRLLETQQCISLESETGLVSDALADTARAVAQAERLSTTGILTYVVNSMRSGSREIPYSLVSAMEGEGLSRVAGKPLATLPDTDSLPPILLNEWAASDLGVGIGATLSLEFFLWTEGGRLDTDSRDFRVSQVVPLEGPALDEKLVPDYPGITETESISDWDPPFPVDLNRIRPKDEDYWHDYRTTPKGFIELGIGQSLWGTRFGRLTSLRFFGPESADLASELARFKANLRSEIDPRIEGLAVFAVRRQGLEASRGATDFGEYFVYFSFFIVVSALLLAGLFFKLGVEQRRREIGLLRAVGFDPGTTRKLFLIEGASLAVAGTVLGMAGALLYGELMMFGLRTWWVDAVGTTLLTLNPSATSLVLGGVGGIVAAVTAIALTLRRLGLETPRRLLSGASGEDLSAHRGRSLRITGIAGLLSTIVALLLVLVAGVGLIGEVAAFFLSGTLILIAALLFQSAWLRRRGATISGVGFWPVVRLGFRNATHRPGRSVLCIALIASAAFIIVAVDSFRRTGQSDLDPRSGTGGFALVAESLLPIAYDPNTVEGRENLSLDFPEEALHGVTFTRLRLRPGDDASCLNLYRPANPRILGVPAELMRSGRFSFQASLAATDEERENPWLLLEKPPADGAVPVIADANSLSYVLHVGLGEDFVLPSDTGEPVKLRVVAALSDSIFQSELMISAENFGRLFPAIEGHNVFLIDVADPGQERPGGVLSFLENRLDDYGFDAVSTAERLASFHRVENTYISTFQTLGALGLLLGTLGLGTVLLRNVLERRRELALLRALGYNPSHFTLMAIAENAYLLLAGLVSGTICAALAIAPAFLSRGGGVPLFSVGLLLLLVLVVGLAVSLLATRAALQAPLLSALREE